ncbi:MAG: F0F1 ATP synthase subunit beta, partial [Anaerolineales bacterium]|nr:F0F1 ATP synthase subunit beta [Anaerolineales bacterium]
MTVASGRIIEIKGGVIDAVFPENNLPNIYDALVVNSESGEDLVLEVENHMGNGVVRCVAMGPTPGLRRGTPVIGTGAPIRVPVGENVLGRVLNVLGKPIDGKGELIANEYYPIHRMAPSFEEQSTDVEVFETGIKSIDLV